MFCDIFTILIALFVPSCNILFCKQLELDNYILILS